MRVEQIALHMPPMQATVSPSTVLDSYRLRARYQMTSSLEDGSEVQQRVETDATWLRTTGPFGFDAQIDMQVASPDEQNELRYVLVGRSAASKSHGEWMTAPRGPDPLADDPNGLIGLPLAASLVQGERLGVDEISGIETTHYRVTDPAFFASMFGRSAPGKGLTAVALDGWVAPAGYLVRYLLNAETAEGSAVDVQGNVLPALNQRIEIEYELTEVNGPVQIVWPADAPPSGALILPGFVRSNFPLPDDAVVVSGPGYIQIQTQLEPVAAQRFFETELTAQGWRLDGEAGAYRAVKGAARMTLMIAQNAQADGGVTVQIRPGELPD